MKQILRFALVALIMMCSNHAQADTTIVGAEDNTSGFWSAFSEVILLEPNKTLQMEFTNYSSMAENWHNFLVVLAMTEGHSTLDNEAYKEYAVVRPDNYGWGDNYAPEANSSNWNWDAFRQIMNGAQVLLTVKRDGDEVTVRADVQGGDVAGSYFQQYVLNIGENDPIYVSLGIDNSHIVIDNDKTVITDTARDNREEGQIGRTDNSTGFFGEYKVFPVMENNTLTLDFINYAGAANWNNFIVALSNVGDRSANTYEEYAIVRADNFAWQVDMAQKSTAPNSPDKSWFTSMKSNYNWDTFHDDMNGAHVVLTIQRSGDQVIVHADITSTNGNTYYYDFVMPVAETNSLFALLGVDGSHYVLNESKCIKQDTPQGIVGLETNTSPFFTHFSPYYRLEPGKTLNATFTNYSSQLGNYCTFLVALANAERDAESYSEYAILRADNYAWQGGKNSFDDQSWFTSLESNYNWDTFLTDLDGASVSMKVVRSVDNPAEVTVRADITATSGETYFEEFVINCGEGTEDLVVFLTTDNSHLIISSATITDSVSTAIQAATDDSQRAAAPIYNIAGQRVTKAVRGIYVQDGKKFIVK